jgi:uncharacterized protein YegP (UPF0339 family)
MGYVVPLEESIPRMTYLYHKDKVGKWRWHLQTASGRIIADSSEGYEKEQECLDDIDRVKASRCAPVTKE